MSRKELISSKEFDFIPFCECDLNLCTEGRLFQNERKNKYNNVIPVDETRVKISSPRGDYINANFVDLGDNKRIIAAQAPMRDVRANTEEDFWTMVYQNRSPLILMLTPLIEGTSLKSSVKSSSYWPHLEEERSFGTLKVKNISVLKDLRWETSILKISSPNSDDLEVVHVYYYGWTDFGVPDKTDIQAILDITLSVWKDRTKPIVCHCSAGLGRTGAFAAILRGKLSEQKENPVDIVTRIRKDRHGLVQTREQFRFVIDVLSSPF